MVLQAELYPHGGYQQQGYVQSQDYYSKNGYGYKEDHYPENGYYESGSSMQMVRPNVTTPQPAIHHMVVGHEGYPHQESGYGKQTKYYDQDSYGYPSGKNHSDGWYGKTHGFSGHESQCYPKPSNGMHRSGSSFGDESHYGSCVNMGPGKYESVSYDYDYYDEGRNRCPPYYEQQHKANKNFAAKGVEWFAKGV